MSVETGVRFNGFITVAIEFIVKRILEPIHWKTFVTFTLEVNGNSPG